MKAAVLSVIGLFGFLVFGALLLITFVSPSVIESSAKRFVKHQIETEIHQKYNALGNSTFAHKLTGIASQWGFEKEQLQQDIKNKLPDKIASVIAAMCGYDCEKKKIVAQSITSSYLDRMSSISVAQKNLANIIKDKYIAIISSLKFDLRIFLGTNTALFLSLLLVSFFKPRAIAHLFLPAILLFVATLLSSSIYVVGQDWFYTILYNDYMGFGYLAYIAVIFGVLVDIVFNHARLTTGIINGVAQAIGSAFSVAPC